jgi:hypothetical protein
VAPVHLSTRRLVVAFALPALALAVVACGNNVAGAPIPAAGFEPAITSSTTASRQPDTPVIPTTRKLTGIDLCTLLTADDLASRGGLVGQPAPRPALFPESCSFPLGGGAAGNAALVAFYRPYDQVRAQQPEGTQRSTLGHSTWLYCTTSDGYQTCFAAVAVRADRSVVVAMSIRDASRQHVLTMLETLTVTVVSRLPPG